jgi:hypothetical protein
MWLGKPVRESGNTLWYRASPYYRPGFDPRLCHCRLLLGDPWGVAQYAQRCPDKWRFWSAGISFSHRALATPCGGPGTDTRWQLKHIHTRQSPPAWLGHVLQDAWLSTFASPEFVQKLQWWDKTVTTNWISRKRGEKHSQLHLYFVKAYSALFKWDQHTVSALVCA